MLDWKSVQDSPDWQEWISLAFAAFDLDGSGTIGMEDLTALLCGGKCVVSCQGSTSILGCNIMLTHYSAQSPILCVALVDFQSFYA